MESCSEVVTYKANIVKSGCPQYVVNILSSNTRLTIDLCQLAVVFYQVISAEGSKNFSIWNMLCAIAYNYFVFGIGLLLQCSMMWSIAQRFCDFQVV